MSTHLTQPLNLTSTTYDLPESKSSSVIPFNSTISSYDAAQYDAAPAGGFYSSASDLRRVGISILNSSLLSPAQTRRWMKPTSLTSNPNFTVGAPWEILRAPTTDGRESWFYTKSGDLGMYSSQMVLLPDHAAGFTVLAAGASSSSNVRILADTVAAIYAPALEAAAREEAASAYAGTFTATAHNSNNSSNSSLIIIVDETLPGLGVQEWIIAGVDMLALLRQSLAGEAGPGIGLRLHLQPSGLKSQNGTKVGWRGVFDGQSPSPDPGSFSTDCISWFLPDALVYGVVGIDEFAFDLGPDGRAKDVQLRAFGVTLSRA